MNKKKTRKQWDFKQSWGVFHVRIMLQTPYFPLHYFHYDLQYIHIIISITTDSLLCYIMIYIIIFIIIYVIM